MGIKKRRRATGVMARVLLRERLEARAAKVSDMEQAGNTISATETVAVDFNYSFVY